MVGFDPVAGAKEKPSWALASEDRPKCVSRLFPCSSAGFFFPPKRIRRLKTFSSSSPALSSPTLFQCWPVPAHRPFVGQTSSRTALFFSIYHFLFPAAHSRPFSSSVNCHVRVIIAETGKRRGQKRLAHFSS